jgi:hypothetical protein
MLGAHHEATCESSRGEERERSDPDADKAIHPTRSSTCAVWSQAGGQGEPVEAGVHTLQTCADTSPGARPKEEALIGPGR